VTILQILGRGSRRELRGIGRGSSGQFSHPACVATSQQAQFYF
jgi:hypothetical protein